MAPPDPHPDLPPPPPRPAPRPADRLGRCGTFDLRRASGLSLWARVEVQAERDALVHRLGQIDDDIVRVTEERRAIVDALTHLRQLLYPPVPWAKGRRPPDVDRSPLPPATQGSQPLGGRDLRVACVSILRRHGSLALPELHGLLHRYGYVIAAPRPVTALSDAMAYEVEHGRAQRVERGVYTATDARPPRSRTAPELGNEPAGNWPPHGRSPLDPDLDEDPGSWATPLSSELRDSVRSAGHH